MKREDKRDEALGALLRRAAETAAGTPGAGRALPEGYGPEYGKVRPVKPRRFRAGIAGAAALAAGLAVAFFVPSLARTRADREFLAAAAGHLSRTLIREDTSFLAELPAASELEAAAADWALSLFPADAGL
jgi:hypothetical protein